jgi:hypothetical protein
MYRTSLLCGNNRRKFGALVAAILIVPALAFAGHGKGNGNDDNGKGDDRGKGSDRDDSHFPVVPEANAGWVLIPFVGAVLLFSWRQFCRAKA